MRAGVRIPKGFQAPRWGSSGYAAKLPNEIEHDTRVVSYNAVQANDALGCMPRPQLVTLGH